MTAVPAATRMAATVLAVIVGLVWRAPLCSSQSYTSGQIAAINQACSQCDNNFLSTVTTYQTNFLGIDSKTSQSTALDIANLHCRSFSAIATCYVTCLQNSTLTYSSYTKTAFQSFYKQFCDTECRLAFLPKCYIDAGRPFDLFLSGCDGDNLKLIPSVSDCIDLWTSKQNCSGVCSAGQRAATGLRLALDSICMVPQLDYSCTVSLDACLERSYGPYGSAFIAGGPSLDGPGSGGCSAFGRSYSQCLNNTVYGQLTFGTPPYSIDYYQPCSSYSNVVAHLIGLSDAAVEPLCDNPLSNLSSICSLGTTAAGTGLSVPPTTPFLTTETAAASEQTATPPAPPTAELSTTEGSPATESATTSSSPSQEQASTTTDVPTAELSTTEGSQATTSSTPGVQVQTTTTIGLPTTGPAAATEALPTTVSATTSSTPSLEQVTTTIAVSTVEPVTTEGLPATESAGTSSAPGTAQVTTAADLPTTGPSAATEALPATDSATTSSTLSLGPVTTTTNVSTVEPVTTEGLPATESAGTSSAPGAAQVTTAAAVPTAGPGSPGPATERLPATDSVTISPSPGVEQTSTTTAVPTAEPATNVYPATEYSTTGPTAGPERVATTTAAPTAGPATEALPTAAEPATTGSTPSVELATVTAVVPVTTKAPSTASIADSSASGTASPMPTLSVIVTPTKKPCKKRRLA